MAIHTSLVTLIQGSIGHEGFLLVMILVVSMWVKAGNTLGVGVGGYCYILAI